jgi:hypothetical protein
MSATLRLKQLLFIAAALALVSLGFVAALSTASPARADDSSGGECLPTQDTLSAWADSGAPITLHDATPPTDPDGTDETSTTNLVRFVQVGTEKHVTQAAVQGTPATALQRHSWNPQGPVDESIASPTWPVPQQGRWQANTSNYNGSDPLGVPFQEGGGNGGDNASWFYWTFTPATTGQDEVSHTDYIWQKQSRTFTEGVDCPAPPEECVPEDYNGEAEGCGTPPEECVPEDYNGEAEGCGTPPEECVPEDYNGQEPGCGTPNEEKPWICHPVNGKGELGNGWNLIAPNDPSSHIDESVYPGDGYWEHMSNDGLRHDVYADLREGEDGKDQSDYTCPGDQLTEVTPHADGATDDCDPDSFGTITVTAVEGVTYTLQDDSTITGTIAANGTNTVTAHLAENYVLAEGAVSEWTFESIPATDCPAPPCEETQEGCPEPPCEETEQGCPEPPCEETEQGCPEPPCEETQEGCPEPPCEETEQGCVDPGPDCEEDPTQEHCEEDDKDCEEDPTQEHCEEDPGPTCQEDPTQPRCDEDNPPVVVPDDGTTPNSPSNGPTVKGSSATAPTVVPGQAAGTPAVQVPTAINSGLGSTQQELAGNGGALGLLGIATALLGAALVGLTIRPKRRIAAALRTRT